jgi:hypothetical protein
LEQANWLIKREVSAGRIYRNASFFQRLPSREVIEVSTIPACISIKNGCTIYRTKHKLPEIWQDNNGPILRRITSIDGSTSFTIITPTLWEDINNDPYNKYSNEKYVFFAEDYLWFPKHNPHKVIPEAFYKDDVRLHPEKCEDCDDEEDECLSFLDTKFMIPDWIEAELMSKAIQQLFPSKQMQEDVQIDKNTNRKS